jgi:broad specificity phosphatase PhoE
MKLYFARHGESEANVGQVFWNGIEGYGLTDKGRGQAAQLADSLQGVRFAAIYASPVLRAVQTAEIVSQRLGVPYEVTDGLREYDVGVLEGKTYSEARWKVYGEVNAAWMEKRDWDARIEGGESYNDIRERFMPLVRRLEAAYRQTDANVLLIGHGGTYRCMMPLLLRSIDNAFALEHHFGYTSCVVAELRGDEWVCLQWGEQVVPESDH